MHNLGGLWWLVPCLIVLGFLWTAAVLWTWALCRAAARPMPTPSGSWDECNEAERRLYSLIEPTPAELVMLEMKRAAEASIALGGRLPAFLVHEQVGLALAEAEAETL